MLRIRDPARSGYKAALQRQDQEDVCKRVLSVAQVDEVSRRSDAGRNRNARHVLPDADRNQRPAQRQRYQSAGRATDWAWHQAQPRDDKHPGDEKRPRSSSKASWVPAAARQQRAHRRFEKWSACNRPITEDTTPATHFKAFGRPWLGLGNIRARNWFCGRGPGGIEKPKWSIVCATLYCGTDVINRRGEAGDPDNAKWFRQGAGLQKTWPCLIRTRLAFDGMPAFDEARFGISSKCGEPISKRRGRRRV
jgi:hypothetical protein